MLLFRYGDIVPVTNAGQMMTIILMLMGIFYMAMPLTASATTFYRVHEEYQNKNKLLEDAQVTAQESVDQKKTDPVPQQRGNKVGPDLRNATVGNSSSNDAAKGGLQQVAASKALPGDKLERRLKKRMELFLNEVYLTHAAMVDLFKDLHATSSQFDDDNNDEENEIVEQHRSMGVVTINGAVIPVLRSVNSSRLSSPLLERVLRLVDKADSLLTGSEDDIVRVVVLQHKLSKS